MSKSGEKRAQKREAGQQEALFLHRPPHYENQNSLFLPS